jgi:hypothetical protein
MKLILFYCAAFAMARCAEEQELSEARQCATRAEYEITLHNTAS